MAKNMARMAKRRAKLPKAQWAQLKIQRLAVPGWGRRAAMIGWIMARIKAIRPKAGWGLMFRLDMPNGDTPFSMTMMINPGNCVLNKSNLKFQYARFSVHYSCKPSVLEGNDWSNDTMQERYPRTMILWVKIKKI